MRPNQRVTIEVVGVEPVVRYASRIEGINKSDLLLSAPNQQSATIPFSVGTQLRVTLFHQGGAHAFETTVLGRQMRPVPVLVVQRPNQLESLQRRRFFRQAAVVRCRCRPAPDSDLVVDGLTRNLGGGGVCLRTRDAKQAAALLAACANQPLWIEVLLPEQPLTAWAKVVWSSRDEEEGCVDLALNFIDLEDEERERLIRYLFVLQRETLKKGI